MKCQGINIWRAIAEDDWKLNTLHASSLTGCWRHEKYNSNGAADYKFF